MASPPNAADNLSLYELYALKVHKFMAIASKEEVAALKKRVALGAHDDWSLEDEAFRNVFDDWVRTIIEAHGLNETDVLNNRTLAETKEAQKEAEAQIGLVQNRRRAAEEISKAYVQEVTSRAKTRNVPLSEAVVAQLSAQTRQAVLATRSQEELRDMLETTATATLVRGGQPQQTAREIGRESVATSLDEHRYEAVVVTTAPVFIQKTTLGHSRDPSETHGLVHPSDAYSLFEKISSKTQSTDPEATTNRTLQMARRLEALSAVGYPEDSDFRLFQTLAEKEGATPGQKALAPVFDRAINALPPDIKERVIERIFQDALIRAPSAVGTLSSFTDRAGQLTAQGVLGNIKINLASSPQDQLRGTVGALGSLVSDLGGAVFRGPLNGEIHTMALVESWRKSGSLGGSVMSPFAHITTHEEHVVWYRLIYYSGVHESDPHHFSLFDVLSDGQFVLSWLKKPAATISAGSEAAAAGSGAAGKGAGGFFGRIIAFFTTRGAAGAAAGTVGGGAAGGAAAGAVAGSVIPVVGTVVGAILGTVAWPLVEKLIGKIKSWFGNASFVPKLDMFRKALTGEGGVVQQPFWNSAGFWILIVVLAAVLLPSGVLLGAAGLPTGATFQETERMTAVAIGAGDGPGGPLREGAPYGQHVSWVYAGGGDPPVSAITACPAHGSITQGPYESFSHANADAYDIAAPAGTPIYAAHDGFVVSFRDSLDPNTFENRSYGNYVLLVARASGGGPLFFTMYAHLETVSSAVVDAKKSTETDSPIIIRAGDPVGTMDATGSTFGGCLGCVGIHLHFEEQGLGSLALPAGCP